jgi:hypothetical protein
MLLRVVGKATYGIDAKALVGWCLVGLRGGVDAAVASPHRAPSAITSRLLDPHRGTKSNALLDRSDLGHEPRRGPTCGGERHRVLLADPGYPPAHDFVAPGRPAGDATTHLAAHPDGNTQKPVDCVRRFTPGAATREYGGVFPGFTTAHFSSIGDPTQPQRTLMPTVANYVVIEDDGITLFTISNLAVIYKTSF